MDWPEYIEDEEDFAEVIYTDEEAEAMLRELAVAMRRFTEALKTLGDAFRACGEAVGRLRDDVILSQEEVKDETQACQ